MQYMLLIYNDPGGWDSMPAERQQEVYAAYGTFTEELQASGKMVAGDALQPISTATSIRVRDGETLTTDGRSPRRRKFSAATTSSTWRRSTRRSSGPRRSPARSTAPSRYARSSPTTRRSHRRAHPRLPRRARPFDRDPRPRPR